MLNSNNACPSIVTGGRSQLGFAGTGSGCAAMTSASMWVPLRSEKEEKRRGSHSSSHRWSLLRKTHQLGSRFVANATQKNLANKQASIDTQLFRLQAARIEDNRVFLQNYYFFLPSRPRAGFLASGFRTCLSSPTTRPSFFLRAGDRYSGGLQSQKQVPQRISHRDHREHRVLETRGSLCSR